MADIKINDFDLLKFLEEQVTPEGGSLNIGEGFPSDRCVCFGEYHPDGRPFWVVALYDFQGGHDCKMDIAIQRKGLLSPATFARIARIVFDYAFKQAGLQRCSLQIRSSNKRSLRMVKKWGFKEEGFVRLGYGDPKPEDKICLGMLKTECPWI